MKPASNVLLLSLLGLALAGCSNEMLNFYEKDTPNQQAAVRQDLTMPPDLSLAPPGAGAPPPAETAYTPPPSAAPAAPAQMAAVAPGQSRPTAEESVYQQAGISLVKPDGTKKTEGELQEELRQVYIARKKAQNPNYGTVLNIGNIFSD